MTPFVTFNEAVEDASRGNSKLPQGSFLPEGPFPVVDQGQQLVAGYSDNAGLLCKVPAPVIVFGDHTRVLKYIDFPFVMGADGVKVLRVRQGWDPKFVFHYLRFCDIPSAGYSRHFKFLKELCVPKPALDDQRRIAMILDKADALGAKRGRTLAHLEDLIQSIFLEMFGDPVRNPHRWDVATLNDLSTGNGQYGANVPSVDYTSDLPRYVRITDVTDSGGLTSDPRSPGGEPKDWDRYVLSENDLLFARSGATVGKTYLHADANGRCVYAGYLIRFQLREEIVDPRFVFAFTKTQAYATWVKNRQNVVAQPNINAKQYGNDLLVPVPPLAQQQEFGRRVAAVAELQRLSNRAKKKETELVHSLRSLAFRGGL